MYYVTALVGLAMLVPHIAYGQSGAENQCACVFQVSVTKYDYSRSSDNPTSIWACNGSASHVIAFGLPVGSIEPLYRTVLESGCGSHLDEIQGPFNQNVTNIIPKFQGEEPLDESGCSALSDTGSNFINRGYPLTTNSSFPEIQLTHSVQCFSTSPQEDTVSNIPSSRLTNPLGTTNIQSLVGTAIRSVMGIVGALALFMFIDGAFTYMKAAGRPDAIQQGTRTMLFAVIGLFVLFASYGILDAFTTLITTGSL